MIEKDILAAQMQAAKKGKKQIDLINQLKHTFEDLKKKGLEDVTPKEALNSESDNLLTENDRTRELVLKTRDLEILNEPVTELGLQEARLAHLTDAIDIVTKQYYWLFAQRIPEPKNGFFKQQHFGDTGWNQSEKTPDLQIDYGYRIKYNYEGNKGTLTSAALRLHTQHDPENRFPDEDSAPSLELSFEDTKLAKIYLSWTQPNPKGLLKLAKESPLEDFLKSNFSFDELAPHFFGRPHEMTIELLNNPKVIISQKFNGFVWNADKKPLDFLISEYQYDAKNDKFVRYFKDEDEYKRHRLPLNNELKNREFIDLLRSTLNLIPTMDVNKIKRPQER